MLLDSSNRSLELIMGEAMTTTNPMAVTDWAAISTTAAPVPATTTVSANGVAAVTLVAAPVSGQRKINNLSIYNVDTVSHVVTVRYNDNTTLYTIVKETLAIGDTLHFTDTEGWFTTDNSGGRNNAPATGRFLLSSLKSSGTSYTTGAATNTIFVRLQAGGGAGGGCTSVASAVAAAGGGSAGGYAEKTFTVAPNTTYTYAIGAGGTGSSGAAGNPGGNTTFAVGATTVTANGGLGGPQAVSAITLKGFLGAASPAVSTNGDLNAGGQPGGGGVSLIVAGPIGLSGNGGSSLFGPGALGVIAAGAGTTATVGFGGGGSGSLTGSSAARAGGDGRLGCIIVDEYS